MTSIRFAVGAALASLALLAPTAHAQESFPQRPVTLVVAYAPGGPVDIIARTISLKLSDRWGKPIVVDNRGGAGGNIGSEAVARATPDGYTLLINTAALLINPYFMDKGAIDAQRDLAPVTKVGFAPALLLVGAKSPYQSVKDLVAAGKANPGKLNFGSPGNGTSLQLAGELFKQLGGFEATHVPYKGTAQANTDVIAGQLDFNFDAVVAALAQVKGGNMRALAVTSTQRVPQLPQTPTMQEAGVAGYDFSVWYGIFAPAKTPAAIVDKIAGDFAQTLKDPGVKTQLEGGGLILVGNSPAAFIAEMNAEGKRWTEVTQKMPKQAK